MTRRQILRSLGLAQTALCGCLLLALWQGEHAYRASVQGLLRSMAETLLTACDTLKLVAESVQSRERIIQESVTTLRSYRDVVLEVRRSTGQASALVPGYASTLDEVAATLKSTAVTVDEVADKLDVSVPSGVSMEDVNILGKSFRLKPVFAYSRPFKESAQQVQITARRMDRLRETVTQTSATMKEQSKSMTLRVNEACDQSVRLLDEISRSLLALKNEELRQAVQNLGQTTSQLKGMSVQILEFERVADKVWLIGMLFGAALLVNALFMLFIPLPQLDMTNPAGKSA